MNIERINLHAAFILHTRPFRDTSLILDVLTRQYGRLSILARGVRSVRSKNRGLLAPFTPLLLSWAGKAELPVLRQAERDDVAYNLQGKMLLSGFYINELLTKLLHRHDAHPLVFDAYKQALIDLQKEGSPEPILRVFEMKLLDGIGYGLYLNVDVDGKKVSSAHSYRFDFGVGFCRSVNASSHDFSGANLLAWQAEQFSDEVLRDAKKILRIIFANLLDGRPIKSRELFV